MPKCFFVVRAVVTDPAKRAALTNGIARTICGRRSRFSVPEGLAIVSK